jgi:hypothetical protein
MPCAPRPIPLLLCYAAIIFGVFNTVAFAQYGVSPSQSGMFFDDLRGRQSSRAGTLDPDSAAEGVYSYDENGFLGYEDETTDSTQAARDIGAPLSNAGYTIYSKRNQGDYTQFSSPYPAAATFFAPTYTSDPFLGGRRNLKLGPVNLGFGLSSVLEYNDNITRAGTTPGTERLDDFIWGTYLNVSANWPVSESSSLSISTAVGFDRYFNHPEVQPYGGDFVVNLLPGSTISFDAMLGPVYVVVYDRMSVRPAAQNDFSINANDIFGVFQNDLGFGASWAINRSLQWSFNYMHSTARVMNDQLGNGSRTSDNNKVQYPGNFFNRDMDSFMTSLAWSPHGTWTAGLEGNMTLVRYPANFQNDGVIASAGAFFATPIGKNTSIRLAGGFQAMEFDDPPQLKLEVTKEKLQDSVDDVIEVQNEIEDAIDSLGGTANNIDDDLLAKLADARDNLFKSSDPGELDQLRSDLNTLDSQLSTQIGRQINTINTRITEIERLLPLTPVQQQPALTSEKNQLLAAKTTLESNANNRQSGSLGDKLIETYDLANQRLNDNLKLVSSNRDNSDLSDFYANFTLSNRLTSRISHALTLGHESALNTTSNYITADFASYGIGFITWRGSRLAISGYYESSSESGGIEQFTIDEYNIVQNVSTREDLNQMGVDVYWTHQLSSRMRLGIGYHYGTVESSLENRDYVQHAFNIDVNYALSRKMTIGLGYRYFQTDADQENFNFDQNRAVLAFNYNF